MYNEIKNVVSPTYNKFMPRQLTKLVNDEIYHIVIRAVGDSMIFKNEDDYYRGIFCIYEFNNTDSVQIWRRRRDRITEKKFEKSVVSPTYNKLPVDKRDKMVEVLAFCFMSNHIHLLVKQLKEGGISRFMKKVGGGYANYFNKKYDRKGHLFNQFRAIHIKTDEQLWNVFVYIHANPISIIESGWKENGIKNPEKVTGFLENYKWSSYRDYIGKENFKSVTQRDFILDVLGEEVGCRQVLEDWIKYRKIKDFGDIVLE